MRRPHPSKAFPPPVGHRPSRARATASLIAAICGGFAVLGVALIVVGTISPSDAPGVYIGVGVLTLIWFTGIWSRWDSPDHRTPRDERMRRGF